MHRPYEITWRDTHQGFQNHRLAEGTVAVHLIEVLQNMQTDSKPTPLSKWDQNSVDCDEVYPGIYIGNGATARNVRYLQSIGITHILNCAEGNESGFVNTNERYYANTGIKYRGLPLPDSSAVIIKGYFFTVAAFINDAVSTGGKAFVHCRAGISRSATFVLAYLMIEKNMLAIDAIRTVRTNRYIHPNNGFLRQLAQLDNQLRRKRL